MVKLTSIKRLFIKRQWNIVYYDKNTNKNRYTQINTEAL